MYTHMHVYKYTYLIHIFTIFQNTCMKYFCLSQVVEVTLQKKTKKLQFIGGGGGGVYSFKPQAMMVPIQGLNKLGHPGKRYKFPSSLAKMSLFLKPVKHHFGGNRNSHTSSTAVLNRMSFFSLTALKPSSIHTVQCLLHLYVYKKQRSLYAYKKGHNTYPWDPGPAYSPTFTIGINTLQRIHCFHHTLTAPINNSDLCFETGIWIQVLRSKTPQVEVSRQGWHTVATDSWKNKPGLRRLI